MIRQCAGSSVARRLRVTQPRRARWDASRRNGSRHLQTSLLFPTCPAIGCARPSPTERYRARHGFEREPDAWRAGEQRVERPLRLHLLSSAVRVQPVRRSGTLHATSRESVFKPVIVRYQGKVLRIYFRADAAFAMPGVYECLEAERVKYAIRIPTNQVLQNRIGYLLKRPVGRPPNEVRRYYANFTYQAASWTKPRRVIAKVEWHPGELVPRLGFIVTNMSRPAERVVAFYNKRGAGGQWMKGGKGVIKWTRLSCRHFTANAVRLQLHALAYNLGNFLRTLATPEPIKIPWGSG